MTVTINAVTSTGLVQTSDGSGVIKVQSNGVTTNALAWCAFTGSTGASVSSYNISSITRNGAGDYTFNFSAATTDANYTYFAQGYGGGSYYQIGGGSQGSGTVKATSSLRVQYGFVNSLFGGLTNQDPITGYIAIFGN